MMDIIHFTYFPTGEKKEHLIPEWEKLQLNLLLMLTYLLKKLVFNSLNLNLLVVFKFGISLQMLKLYGIIYVILIPVEISKS